MEQFVTQLGYMSMQAVVVILTVLLVRVIFASAHVPKKYVNLLWLVPYIVMACPWKISSAFSFWRMPMGYSGDSVETGRQKVQQTLTQVIAGEVPGNVTSGVGANTGIAGNPPMGNAAGTLGVTGSETMGNVVNNATYAATETTVSLADIIGLVWLLGVVVLLAYSVISYVKLRRKVICSVKTEGNIYYADDITSAFVLGVIRPKIYLPSGLKGDTFQYVLEHEKTHIKRFDPLKKVLAFGITVVHWFNPLAWVAFYFFCKDMEMACDEETVLRIGMEKKQDYATALLQLSAERNILLGAPLAFGENSVKDRIRNIAGFKKVWVVVSVVAVLVIVAMAVGFLSKYEEDAEPEISEESGTSTTDDKQIAGNNGSGESETVTTPEATPEPTAPPDAENGDEWSKVYPWADLDGDGTEEYILIERGGFLNQNSIYGRITVYVNNEPVYQYTEDLWITGVHQMEYLDLDGDGQEEIFVSFGPAVNSMSLEEWFVLKKVTDGWELLEMYHYGEDMRDNGFPITVVLKNGQFEFGIRCEGWDGEIDFDATAKYERLKEEVEMNNDAYTVFMDAAYEIGDVVGNPLAYGVWSMQTGTYEGNNCLIAEHGLGGMWGKYEYYGNVYVYFAYDAEGKIRILDMTFSEADY